MNAMLHRRDVVATLLKNRKDLLVVAGLYAAKGELSLLLLNLLIIPAAVLGDALSYHIGKKSGPLLFNRPRSRFFRPEHLKAAHAYYERHGGKTIVITRLVWYSPIKYRTISSKKGLSFMCR